MFFARSDDGTILADLSLCISRCLLFPFASVCWERITLVLECNCSHLLEPNQKFVFAFDLVKPLVGFVCTQRPVFSALCVYRLWDTCNTISLLFTLRDFSAKETVLLKAKYSSIMPNEAKHYRGQGLFKTRLPTKCEKENSHKVNCFCLARAKYRSNSTCENCQWSSYLLMISSPFDFLTLRLSKSSRVPSVLHNSASKGK